MKNKFALHLLTVLGILLFLVSCEYEFVEPPPPPPVQETFFGEHVIPIFESDGCLTCHNGGLAFDLSANAAYNSITSGGLVVPFNADESLIYTVPNPQSAESHNKYKSVENANRIYSWIMLGALDN